MANFTIDFGDLTLAEMVGKGNFGEVWKGSFLGTPVAIKRLLFVEEEAMRKYIEREIATLTTLRHPNIVQLLGVSLTDDDIYIVMEYVEGGPLRSRLKNPRIPISWRQRLEWAREVALAMAYLHHENKMHRDLKSANLLLSAELRIKVCDFGLARDDDDPEDGTETFKTVVGTNEWMAPEVMMQQPYDKLADIFSYGMVLWEMLTRSKPLERPTNDLFAFVPRKWEPKLPKDAPRELWQLMCDCCQTNPALRPTFRDIVDRLEAMDFPEEHPSPSLSLSPNLSKGSGSSAKTSPASTPSEGRSNGKSSSSKKSGDKKSEKSDSDNGDGGGEASKRRSRESKKKSKNKDKFGDSLQQSSSVISDEKRVTVTTEKVVHSSLTSRATHSITMTCSIRRKTQWSSGSNVKIRITIGKSKFKVARFISITLVAVNKRDTTKKKKRTTLASSKYKPDGFPLKDGRDFKGRVVFTLPNNVTFSKDVQHMLVVELPVKVRFFNTPLIAQVPITIKAPGSASSSSS